MHENHGPTIRSLSKVFPDAATTHPIPATCIAHEPVPGRPCLVGHGSTRTDPYRTPPPSQSRPAALFGRGVDAGGLAGYVRRMAQKLGEALARRAELQARLGEVRDRLRVSALAQEGDRPAEDPEPLLEELEDIATKLESLIAQINHTNVVTRLSSGQTLTQALARRDVLGVLHGALKAVADATAQQQARYSRSEIRLVRTFDVSAVRSRVDQLARDRRQLDVEIQNANWTVELQQDSSNDASR